MPSHRKETAPRLRPRVRRIAAATVSTVITAVALLGAAGVIPLGGAGSATSGSPRTENLGGPVIGLGAPQNPQNPQNPENPDDSKNPVDGGTASDRGSSADATGSPPSAKQVSSTALPTSSGSGKRVVFSQKAQRVWLVDSSNHPVATYLVSGSVTDNLEPGRYAVYSRSRWAVGVDDSGVMQYFVRFAHGSNAAIGFHSIPSKLGKPLQKISQLGTPQSHGCIRQKLSDAERMWNFAKNGTAVVVVS